MDYYSFDRLFLSHGVSRISGVRLRASVDSALEIPPTLSINLDLTVRLTLAIHCTSNNLLTLAVTLTLDIDDVQLIEVWSGFRV